MKWLRRTSCNITRLTVRCLTKRMALQDGHGGVPDEAGHLQIFLNHPPKMRRVAQVCSCHGDGRSVRGTWRHTVSAWNGHTVTPPSRDRSKAQGNAPPQRVEKYSQLSRKEFQGTHQRADI